MKLHSSSDMQMSAINALMSVADVSMLIAGGSTLSVAGPEAALDKLPAGNWIGGTTPYFLTENGGQIVSDDQVFVTDLSTLGDVTIVQYDADALAGICTDAPENGFAMVIIPAFSTCHERFALESPFFPDAFLKPTVGWVAGFNVETGGQAYVYDGRGPFKCDNQVVVADVAWRDDSMVRLDIINPFSTGDGDQLRFATAGFTQTHCLVNGVERPFAAYLAEQGLADMRRPMIGDYGGAPINVAIQSIDNETGVVRFYAPAFPDVDYRFAAPLSDYSAAFHGLVGEDAILWSCNCVLNFMLGEMAGETPFRVAGPVTFGEIAYQLLTQTMVVLRRV